MIASSVKDIVFSQQPPQTKLQVAPGISDTMASNGDASKVDEPLSLAPVEATLSNESGNGATNGADGANGDVSTTKTSRFDPNFTESVIKATGPKANPRVAKIMASLTRHLHDFCRENEITIDEYMAGIDLVR